jgi:hypothetical protein
MSTQENEQKPEGTDDGRPEWLPENFKDAEAFRKSYDEQRKEMDRLRNQADEERAQFAAALERIEAAPPAPAPAQTGLDPQTTQLLHAYQQAVENQDAATMLSIQLALNQQSTAQVIDERLSKLTPTLDTQAQADRNIAFELAQERVAKRYGDQWSELQPEVDAWLREHPAYLPVVNDPAQFEAVIAEGAQVIVNAKRAEEFARFEADRQAKLGSQTATGVGQGKYPTATDDKKQAWTEIAGADIGSYGQMRGGS